MILGISNPTTNASELFNIINNKNEIITGLTNLNLATAGKVNIEIETWSGNSTSISLNIPALFNNSNKIDDWKKLLPSIKLVKLSGGFSSESEDEASKSMFNMKKEFEKMNEILGDEDATPDYTVLPDIISKHAYNFSNGNSWLFGSSGLFPDFKDQYGLLNIIMPPEIYGNIYDKDKNPVKDSMILIGRKNLVDSEMASETIPQFDLIFFFKTYTTGYYSIPCKSKEATEIYIVSIKTENPYSPPATGDLVGIYADPSDYDGMTEIATPGELFKALSYRKSIDMGYLALNSTDTNADIEMLPLGFTIKVEEKPHYSIEGSVKCYLNSSSVATKSLITLYDTTKDTMEDATDTNAKGYYKFDNFNISDGDLCEIEAFYNGEDGITEQGTFAFVYHSDRPTILGTITIYSTNTNLNYLNVNWNITVSPDTIERIWPVIEDSDTNDLFYKTAKWGDDYRFKLPKGNYNVWIEYVDTSSGSPEIKETSHKTLDFTTTGESTEINFDIP
jgi:hypothetical protein